MHPNLSHFINVCIPYRVAYLAGRFVNELKKSYEGSEGIGEIDVLCVQIAGLCHDIGECLLIKNYITDIQCCFNSFME